MNTEAQKIFDRLKKKHKLKGDTQLDLLEMYAGSMVNLRNAQKMIDEKGVTVDDRYGIPKANPAVDVVRINKTQAMQALKQLGLGEVELEKDPILDR